MTEELVRDNDSLGTPAWILDLVRQLGPICLDPCNNTWSLTYPRVSFSFDKGQDGLASRWIDAVRNGSIAGDTSGVAFVNPPYSKPHPWCDRIVEAADDGLEVVALLKLDPSTKWSRVIRDRRDARCDLHRRVRFEGGKFAAGAMASTLAYFGPRPHLFAHIFQPHGEVQVYRVPKNGANE